MINYECISGINEEKVVVGKLETGGGFVVASDNVKELLSLGKLAIEGLFAVTIMQDAIETNNIEKLEKDNLDIDKYQDEYVSSLICA